MAVLGTGGILELSRAIPEPLALTTARININNAVTTISVSDQGYWAGDRVIIAAALGVPFDVNGDGYADCPDGHGFYRGGIWETGFSRDFYSGPLTDGSPWYNTTIGAGILTTQDGNTLITQSGDILEEPFDSPDNRDWYNNASNVGFTTQADGYMSRDELDRIRLWNSEAAGHSGSGTEKIIAKVKCGNFVFTYFDDTPAYTAAIDEAATLISPLILPKSEQPLSSVIQLPIGFGTLCDAVNRNWNIQCDLSEWVMSVDATNLDITSIGETFGESVKSLVRGAGSLQFFADHRARLGEEDGLTLLRLVLLTQGRCNTKARFYLYKDRDEGGSTIDGSVYYECDILLTNSSLNTRATEAIAGTADFVATSEIRLKVAPL